MIRLREFACRARRIHAMDRRDRQLLGPARASVVDLYSRLDPGALDPTPRTRTWARRSSPSAAPFSRSADAMTERAVSISCFAAVACSRHFSTSLCAEPGPPHTPR